jgi:thiosulfate reductase cytochrome b subunit
MKQEHNVSTKTVHPLTIRLTHWINVFAVIIMILSGWKIYNASPIFNFMFPKWITLGGWLGGALALHFAMMWLLVINGLIYFIYSIATGHFKEDIFGFRPNSIYKTKSLTLRSIITHGIGEYNIIQRILYSFVILDLILLILSGLSIWKPAQFDELVTVLGGYDFARIIHFYAMVGLVGFIIIHVMAGLLVKGTILSMITGKQVIHNEQRS